MALLYAFCTPADRGSGLESRPIGYTLPFARCAGWSLLPTLADADADSRTRDAAVEHVAHTLLLRHGTVFRAALEAENGAPPWRELLYVYRWLEARGELRGGRFVERLAGEQYAALQALDTLRALRRRGEVAAPELALDSAG